MIKVFNNQEEKKRTRSKFSTVRTYVAVRIVPVVAKETRDCE